MYSPIAALSVLSIAIAAVQAQVPANTQVMLKFEGGDACLTNNGEENGGTVYIAPCPTARTPHDSVFYWNVVNGGFSSNGVGPTTAIQVFGGTYCLDVKDGSNANGNHLQLWQCTGGPNQQFHVNSKDFTISWGDTKKCIDLPGGLTDSGVAVQIWDCDSNNPNQHWGFAFPPSVAKPVAPAGVAVGLIDAGLPPQSSVCISAADNKNGAPVMVAACGDTTPDNEKFTFTKGGALPATDGVIVLGPSTQIRVFDNMCLDLTDGVKTAGNGIQLWECAQEGTNPNQQWQFNSDNTITLAGNATLAIQIKDNSLQNATPLVISQNGHLPSQLWAAFTPK